jgi:hypothetical protein
VVRGRLQVRVHSPRNRAGTSAVPVVIADAPKVVWALDFQFDSTIDRNDTSSGSALGVKAPSGYDSKCVAGKTFFTNPLN